METDRIRILKQQLQIFEERIAKCETSYSSEKFRENFLTLKNTWTGRLHTKITSLQALRRVLDEHTRWLEERGLSSSYDNEEEDEMSTYFKWYLEFIKYFRRLKQGYDDKIHKILVQYGYNDAYKPVTAANDDVTITDVKNNVNMLEIMRNRDHLWKVVGLNVKSSELVKSIEAEYKQITSRDPSADIDRISEDILSTGRRLESLMRDNADLWTPLPRDENITPHDSYSGLREKQMTTKPSDMHVLARLVPAVIEDFENLSKYAREWYDLDQQRSSNFQNDFLKLKLMNRQVTAHIRDLETQITLASAELKNLDQTLDNFDRMDAREQQLKTRLLGAKRELARTRQQRELAVYERADLLRTKERLTDDYGKDAGEVATVHNLQTANFLQLDRLERDKELYEYKLALVESDLDLDTELRPTVIRFTQTAQEQREKKEEELRLLRSSCARLEEILTIIRADRHHVETEILKHTMLRNKKESVVQNQRLKQPSPPKIHFNLA